jgi:hypothetical protein
MGNDIGLGSRLFTDDLVERLNVLLVRMPPGSADSDVVQAGVVELDTVVAREQRRSHDPERPYEHDLPCEPRRLPSE